MHPQRPLRDPVKHAEMRPAVASETVVVVKDKRKQTRLAGVSCAILRVIQKWCDSIRGQEYQINCWPEKKGAERTELVVLQPSSPAFLPLAKRMAVRVLNSPLPQVQRYKPGKFDSFSPSSGLPLFSYLPLTLK